MGYGDIIQSQHQSNETYRELNGVETVSRAVVLKDASTKGSSAINYTSNTTNLAQLELVKAYNNAGLYVGTQGDVLVLFSSQSVPVVTGTADTNTTNKLVDSTASFTNAISKGDNFIQVRDVVVNKNNGNAAFVGNVPSLTTIDLVDINNNPVDIFPNINKPYEIYRAILIQNIAAGSFLPIQVDRVFTIGTTADDIIAIY